jgi:hypothetical protein
LATDLAEADRLIADIAALLDAGLVVAHEHVLGPVRYGLTSGEGERARVSSRSAKDAFGGPRAVRLREPVVSLIPTERAMPTLGRDPQPAA